jgi:hypothetical protein
VRHFVVGYVPVIDGKIEKFYPEKNHENINDYPDNKD